MTWKLIALGLDCIEGTSPLLTYSELLDYLTDCLGRNARQIDNIIHLICNSSSNDKVKSIINSFVADDSSLYSIQQRKWRVYRLKSLLDMKHQDYLQGLLSLMEFWTAEECSDNCPQTFPTDNDQVSIQTYFTAATYQNMLERNSAWLEKEIQSITRFENDLEGL